MPTVSIITPVYNAEKTIRETIASVLAQTFTDFELILIDDGSTDDSLSIMQRFSDPRIQLFTFPNAGPQKSRNRGIDKATGQYLAFIDADDLWSTDKLECQVNALRETPQAAVAYSWTDVINEQSQVIHPGRYQDFEGDVFEPLLRDNFLGSGSNPLVRAEAMRTVGGFDEAIVAGQDWDMWLTLATRFKFVVVRKVQIFYRKISYAKSWSSNLKRQEVGLTQVIEKHVGHLKEATTLKNRCIASCYRYLLFECFEKCAPTPQNGRLAFRFFWRAITSSPCWWMKRQRLILIGIVLMKTIAYLLSFPRVQPPSPAAVKS